MVRPVQWMMSMEMSNIAKALYVQALHNMASSELAGCKLTRYRMNTQESTSYLNKNQLSSAKIRVPHGCVRASLLDGCLVVSTKDYLNRIDSMWRVLNFLLDV